MNEKLLSIEQVAQYLNLPETAIKELVEKGNLPAYKIGGVLLRFKREHVEKFRKRQDSDVMVEKVLSQDRGITNIPTPITDSNNESLWIQRRNAKRMNSNAQYTFLEKLEDFLYYNDFYILSLILLILIALAAFGT
jgi:excisionase family DNA binding protein